MKSIAQMYAEEVKALPPTKYGRPDPLATSRIKADLQVRFWLPIAEMLDPCDRGHEAGGAAQEFYSRGRHMLSSHEMVDSLALMKRYLGVPRLTLDAWFRLRPIFGSILADALTHADMDLIACAARQFVRIELGENPDPKYGLVDQDVILEPVPDPGCTETDDWIEFFDESHLAGYDWKALRVSTAWQKSFEDAAEFEQQFPGMSERRLNIVRALQPIFDRDTCGLVMQSAIRSVTALLAIDFKETRLGSNPPEHSTMVEVA
jgi:hypothetical protein